jgi:hypothetical protein
VGNHEAVRFLRGVFGLETLVTYAVKQGHIPSNISNNQQEGNERPLFWSGLGFGIAIPILVTAAVELANASVAESKNRRDT